MAQFKYFLNPEQFACLLDGLHECDICHEQRKCFDGRVFYGSRRYQAFCFDCVSTGRLIEVGASGADPDIAALKRQLISLYPNKSEAEIGRMVSDITTQLEYSTPMVPSWQDLAWPAHCGDYCQFIRLAGQSDFNSLANNGNGKDLFHTSLYYDIKADTDVESVWQSLKPGSISGVKDTDDNWSTQAFVFKCLKCGELVTTWDCD